jgi:hypothetical protein
LLGLPENKSLKELPMAERQKKDIKVNLRYDFSEREKKEIATELANANQRKVMLEDQKKQVDADLKAQITEAESAISRESRKYTNGYEYRDIDCEIYFHFPTQGKKTTFRLDTGELVREAAMEPHELQDNLFQEAAEA